MQALELETGGAGNDDDDEGNGEMESFMGKGSPSSRIGSKASRGFGNSPPSSTNPAANNVRLVLGALSVVIIIVVYTFGFAEPSAKQQQQQQQEQEPEQDGDKGGGNPFQSDQDKDSNDGGKEEKEMFYSKYATVVPDPMRGNFSSGTKKELKEKWGNWHFWDGEEEERPDNDYTAAYPNRDMPGEYFHEMAWQADAVFVNHLLDDGEKLFERATEAIYSEYGYDQEGMTREQRADRRKMFDWEMVEFKEGDAPPDKYSKHGNRGNGGYTSSRSFDGLVRRLLHAIMTNDEFVVVVAGHSAAAGHGNLFRQSYGMQFHRIMAPIFARLGVRLVTRNLAMGGLGTTQSALGYAHLYGNDIDLLLWDSGMTEGMEYFDFFARQALMVEGGKVPVIWGGYYKVFKELHNAGEADVGEFGWGYDGVEQTTSDEQALTLPYATRWLKCPGDLRNECAKNTRKFNSVCWVNRTDVNPLIYFDNVAAHPSSQVKWHPGWRHHQLVSRVIAFAVLDALQAANEIFSEGTMGGPPLDDTFWHVTDYYNNIRKNVKNMRGGFCEHIEKQGLPKRLCWTPMKGASQYTPRPNPEKTSLTSLVKKPPNGEVPRNTEEQVDYGEDVPNPIFSVPPGEVDVLAIVSNRRRRRLVEPGAAGGGGGEYVETPFDDDDYRSWLGYSHHHHHHHRDGDRHKRSSEVDVSTTEGTESDRRHLGGSDEIVTGLGWEVKHEHGGQCDGGYLSICHRTRTNSCPLDGHHDSRGMIVGNAYSGWLVMNIPEVSEGIIIVHLNFGIDPDLSTVTEGWTSVNNQRGRRLTSERAEERHASDPPPTTRHPKNATTYLDDDYWKPEAVARRLEDLPDNFVFEFAINKKSTTWDREKFKNHTQHPERALVVHTLLDDKEFPSSENVELAIRVKGCGRECAIGLSHVYWA